MNNKNLLWFLLAGVAITAVATADSKTVSKVKGMIYPLFKKITSPFGNRTHPVTGKVESFHNGIDLAGKIGDKIISPEAGIVTSRYYNDQGGNQLIIKHTNGFTSGFAHLNKYYVNQGDKITKGQIIAEVGNTGQVTGPHLHYTLRNKAGELVDPVTYLT